MNWYRVLEHAIAILIADAILIAIFKWHKPHIGKNIVDL